ncbi:MAG: glycoside hydrolase family 65 protein, partial [Spirochaetota bacterium]|nr:glycoside hydrolase family 65 protein [Spirochaetota bacterium]
MKSYLERDPWNIIEEDFHPELNRASESIFSIGNGRVGQRANFEERYSGQTLQGSYIGGIYYPDKTRVGWWKNGYPEYFAKVLNAPNWIGIDIDIDGEQLDLDEWKIEKFRRVLHMREGYLERFFTVSRGPGLKLNVNVQRFLSLKRHETGAVRYSILVEKGGGRFSFTSYVDADVVNEDANYGEKFWQEVERKRLESHLDGGCIVAATKKTDFRVGTAYVFQGRKNGVPVGERAVFIEREKYVGHSIGVRADTGDRLELCKYAGIASSLNHEKDEVGRAAAAAAEEAGAVGFPGLLEEQTESWEERWRQADIVIEGDDAAQQGIRFNIFQLYQTYTGDDERLNIGPKGFTGEKYGGSTYWDTEAYCLPFYLATAPADIGRKLLVYRYRHLPKAIENAARLGFTG